MRRQHAIGAFCVLFSTLSLALLSVVNLEAASPEDSSAGESTLPQVRQINEHIRGQWADYELSPATKATDGEWCRRIYLDILGRIPSVTELQAFTGSKESDKRAKLVTKLLYDDDYVEEYARNWTTLWTNILIGRNGGMEDNTLTSRPGMQKYLRDSIARNKPYDKMVYELVTATGTAAPGSASYNGAVNFLVNKVNEEKATLATASTAKIFLGLQVQCTQCHNHPFNEWKQQKFWEMNAFFRQTRALRTFVDGTRDIASAELVDEDFGGEDDQPAEARLFYELRNGLLQVAYPVFVDGQEVGKSGFVEDVIRRKELGKLMVESEYMDKMIVNRMWAHFLGYGFTKPIDDMGPHNPPTHPELLDYLGQQVRESSYNLKELIRWIVLSEPYALSSKMPSANATDDPLLGETPKFSYFYLRQMRAEELYESLLVATEAHKTQGSYEDQESKKGQWLQQFIVAFGTDEGDETTTFNGSIPQALMLFNGDLIKQATNSDKGSFLWQVANSNKSPREKIEYLYLAAMARRPSANEVGIANKLFIAREGNSVEAMQDVWWALLNSNEFIINH